jgi:hypothetical protein
MKVVLIHGFNVKDGGAKTVDRLAPYLEQYGYQVDKDEADYGYLSLFAVRLKKHKAILRIVKAMRTADVVIAHSNGANYVLKALKFITENKIRVVFLSPAANRKAKFAESASRVDVFYSRTDFWVWLSGFLLFHPWGRMGQRGPKTNDPRVFAHNYSDMVRDHSDWFDDAHVSETTRAIFTVLQEEP